MNRHWSRFWMRLASLKGLERISTYFAVWRVPPQKGRVRLAYMSKKGYISTSATISHKKFISGANIFIDDRVEIFQSKEGGAITLGNKVCIYRDVILETGLNGEISVGDHSSIHPRCQLNAYAAKISIGNNVMIAANCALYPYDHGIAAGIPISKQPLHSKGDIIIKDGAWLGYGVIVLSGVRIGKGAVVGAGSVVTKDIPDNGVSMGVPARVVKMR